MTLNLSKQFCTVVLSIALLFSIFPNTAHAMLGSENQENQNKKAKLPEHIEDIITVLINMTQKGNGTLTNNQIKPFLDYMLSYDLADVIEPKERKIGEGMLMRSQINAPFKTFLQYTVNPHIPLETVIPNVLRYSDVLKGGDSLTKNLKVWEDIYKIKNGDKPKLIFDKVHDEITPDTFSGAYYDYTSKRMLVLLNYKNIPIIITVTKQDGISSVGHKSAIVGKDSDWTYVFSDEEGCNLSLVGWAKTYVYDSAMISVAYPPTSTAKNTKLSFFKYLSAGWSDMNMVKSKHITEGSVRFIQGLNSVLSSPKLPKPQAIIAKIQELAKMDEKALRLALQDHSNKLASLVNKAPLSDAPFKDLVKDGKYAETMTAKDMRSELLKLYMKQSLGK